MGGNGKISSSTTSGTTYTQLIDSEDFHKIDSTSSRRARGLSYAFEEFDNQAVTLDKTQQLPKPEAKTSQKMQGTAHRFFQRLSNRFSKLGQKAENSLAKYRDGRLAKKTDAFLKSKTGEKLAKPFSNKGFELDATVKTYRAHGGPGATAFAKAFVGDIAEEFARLKNLPNPKPEDKERLQNLVDDKIILIFGSALNSEGGAVDFQTADYAFTATLELLHQGPRENASPELKLARDIMHMASEKFSSVESGREFVLEQMHKNYDTFTEKTTYLRQSSPLSNLLMRLGMDGIPNNRNNSRDALATAIEENNISANLVHKSETRGEDKISDDPIKRQKMIEDATARSDLAVKGFDAIYGEDGSKFRDMIGEDAVKHLQAMGQLILDEAKERNIPPEEANHMVRQLYQNVAFLKGPNSSVSQFWAGAENQKNPNGYENFLNPKYRDVALSISQDIQKAANYQVSKDMNADLDGVDGNTTFAELRKLALGKSGLNDRIDTLYATLGMPQIDIVADATNFAEQMTGILNLNQPTDDNNNLQIDVGGQHLHPGLTDLLRSIDTPEVEVKEEPTVDEMILTEEDLKLTEAERNRVYPKETWPTIGPGSEQLD